jgi:hypothetical protein
MSSVRRARAAGLVVALLAGCSVLGPPPADISDIVIDPDLGARPEGPVVEIARGTAGGTEWAIAAFIADSGNLCTLDVVSGSMSGSACGPVDPLDVIGPIATVPFVGDGGLLVYAAMDADARRLRVETPNGNVEADVVSLEPIGVDRVAAALHLPPGLDPTAVIALDDSGAEVERFELSPMR